MKLLSQNREAAPGYFGGAVSLSDKEQLGDDSEVMQSVHPTKQSSPLALQWGGGLNTIKASQKRDASLLLAFPSLLAPSAGAGSRRGKEPGARLLLGE